MHTLIIGALLTAGAFGQVVSSVEDAGPGTLRNAIAGAPPGATITFAPELDNQTIYITSPLVIDKDLAIDGAGLNRRPRVSIEFDFHKIEIAQSARVAIQNVDFDLPFVNRGSLSITSSSIGGPPIPAIENMANATLQLTDVLSLGFPGVLNSGGTVALNNTRFQGGNGIVNLAGTVGAMDCRFQNENGTAIRIEAGRITGGRLVVDPGMGHAGLQILAGAAADLFDSQFTRNEFGAIQNAGNLTLTRCAIRANANHGGVINSGFATLTDCEVADNYSDFPGAGIDNAGQLTLVHGAVSRNGNFASGGGIRNGPAASLSINHTVIAANSAASGAGLYNEGVIIATDVLISENHGVNPQILTTSAGGAIYSRSGSITLNDCRIVGQRTPSNAGILKMAGDLTLVRCVVANNISEAFSNPGIDCYGGTGAAIASASGSLRIVDSTIAFNQAPGNRCVSPDSNVSYYDGGAGGISATGDVTVIRSTIVNNIGSGIAHSAGKLTILQSTIASNRETGRVDGFAFTPRGGRGGGILASGILCITNSTIVGNSASIQTVVKPYERGGGIDFTGSEFSLQNSIVAGNSAESNPDIFGSYTGNHNIVGGDPMLEYLTNNGGWTETMRPLPGSPAVDAGALIAFETDQRGGRRVIGFAQDIGAVESNDYRPLPISGGYNAAGGIELRFSAPQGLRLTVVAAEDPAIPVSAWARIGFALEGPVGTYTIEDSFRTSARFYAVIPAAD